MGRGLSPQQRALLEALGAHDVDAVWAGPWRRSAKRLVRRGLARAIYLRKQDRSGRMVAHLALTAPDSQLQGDAYPLGSPGWVDAPPPSLLTFGTRLQALVVGQSLDRPVSKFYVTSWAAEERRAHSAVVQVAVPRELDG
ncbi:hypothetical protein RPIT_10870 [Tessaracoccus flavus]|uniref:Uncharacterized protein n=1 Tax=Tessaracoccus flavus TaxID=1610493 RepID=A0A1Q2CGK0_9ACTN|nr:hypothetical protein RPIT_10870 [Tessaracoccus flavus]